MPLTDNDIDSAVKRYIRERDRYWKLAQFVATKCRELIEENGIRATVQARAKDPASLTTKLTKDRANYGDENDVFSRMKDFSGVRVTTYVETDRQLVVDAIETAFAGTTGKVSITSKDSHESFYRATHCQVLLDEKDLVGEYDNLGETGCEIQVCSLLAHVWNEIEHDLGYKPLTGELSELEQDSLKALGTLTQAGDFVIKSLISANVERLAKLEGEFVDRWDFVARMTDKFPSVTNFGGDSKQLFDDLRTLELDSPQRIEDALLRDSYESHAKKLLSGLRDHLEAADGNSPRLDENSSDLLLMLLLEAKATEVIAIHPVGYAAGRPPRIATIAKRFAEWHENPIEPHDAE